MIMPLLQNAQKSSIDERFIKKYPYIDIYLFEDCVQHVS